MSKLETEALEGETDSDKEGPSPEAHRLPTPEGRCSGRPASTWLVYHRLSSSASINVLSFPLRSWVPQGEEFKRVLLLLWV